MIFTYETHGVLLGLGAVVRPLKRELKWRERVTHWVRHEETIPRARELGWEVDDSHSTMCQNGPKFKRNISEHEHTLIWKCREFWQCADYLRDEDGCIRAQNHRPMNYLNDLLEREGVK